MSMLLCDLGNSRLSYCLADRLDEVFHLTHEQLRQGDLFELSQCLNQVSKAYIASVAKNDVLSRLTDLFYADHLPWEILRSQQTACSVTNGYDFPELLGVDRWLAMLAARHLYPDKPVMIVDAGTAMTMDCLDENGRHVGGYILPGYQSMQMSLFYSTQLTDGGRDSKVSIQPGTNTQDCVQNGVLLSLAASVQVAFEQFSKGLNQSPVVILSGGDALRIQSKIDLETVIKDNLVLLGMSLSVFSRVEEIR